MKPDSWIKAKCQGEYPMIEPFSDFVRKEGDRKVISHGLSSYGYDLRCGNEFKIFTNINAAEVDPLGIDEHAFVTVTVEEGGFVRIPPNSFALTHSLEYLRIPRDVLCISAPKSTYCRSGIIVPTTILEPEWEGHLTVEISNTTPLPARVYAGQGICQLIFSGSDYESSPQDGLTLAQWLQTLHPTACNVSYADRKGKYQGQRGITLPLA